MSKWSALVYSRTYEVDFRLIAIPDYFNDEDKKWALNYILGTTRSTASLDLHPRWSLFKNERYCVIGVTCRASDLVELTDLATEERTKDFQKRPLFTFVGYVTKVDQERGLPLISPYTGRNLEFFKPLYQDYVCKPDIWFVKSYEKASKEVVKSNAQELIYPDIQKTTDLNLEKYQLQTDGTICCLWPDSETDRENLWLVAAQRAMAYPNESLSLCLGLSTQNEASYSLFWNATALDVVKRVSVKWIKPAQEEKAPVKVEIKRPSQPSLISETSKEYTPKDQSDSREVLTPGGLVQAAITITAGGTVGGLVGWKFGGIPGSILGATIGATVAGGTGLLVTSRLTDESDRRSSSNREPQQVNNYDSQSQEHNQEPVESGYGFTAKNKQQNSSDSEQKEDKKSSWF
jgi:hypothetical protein